MVRDATRMLIAGGARIHIGTDTPYPFVTPGESAHEEMKLLNSLGLSLDRTWDSATSGPGRFLSDSGLGEIRVGAPADILLFREDPTRELDALSTLEIVVADGRVYRVADLQRQISEQLDYLDGPVYRFVIEPLAGIAIQAAHRRLVTTGQIPDAVTIQQ